MCVCVCGGVLFLLCFAFKQLCIYLCVYVCAAVFVVLGGRGSVGSVHNVNVTSCW